MEGYKKLQIYEKSYMQVVEIYRITSIFPREELYAITSQLRRAAASIPLNIAEGYGKRKSGSEFKRFLMMAIGSCDEIKVLLDFCKDLDLMSGALHARYYSRYEEVGKMLYSLHNKWE